MESNIINIKKGLKVERLGEAQVNIFIDDRLYCIEENRLRALADKIADKSNGSINVYLGEFRHGCVVVIENLAKQNNNYDLGEAIASICSTIAGTSIF